MNEITKVTVKFMGVCTYSVLFSDESTINYQNPTYFLLVKPHLKVFCYGFQIGKLQQFSCEVYEYKNTLTKF